MIQEWKHVLTTKAPEWGLPTDGQWNFLLHNNYHPGVSTFNVLWFHGNDRFPRVVAKICREHSTLAHEFESLTSVCRLAESHVPKPLCLDTADELWALWMTGVPGRRIPPREVYPSTQLEAIVDMLASIHQPLAKPSSAADPGRHQRMVAKPLAALSEWGPSAEVRQYCQALAAICTEGWLQQLPVIPQHGDVFLDNIICDRDSYYLLDWETFGAIDLPFYDFLTLLTSIMLASGKLPQHLNRKLTRQIPALVQRYAQRLGLPVSLVPVLLPLALANWFYLHWQEERQPVMQAMYNNFDSYVRNKDFWDGIFVQ